MRRRKNICEYQSDLLWSFLTVRTCNEPTVYTFLKHYKNDILNKIYKKKVYSQT